ncbi:MAG: benzoate-CoA ligase family protein [Paracoccus sp. (in: a-proteobacteria)]|nr:benzoate-CoA ligase family protein [Paracoccus sp. (in: a-proteobacteria)]
MNQTASRVLADKATGNAASFFIDRHIEEGRAAKIAYREAGEGGRSLSYGDLAAESARFAGALREHDIRREERALMLVLDRLEFPVIFWGCLKAGVVPIPLNTLLSGSVYDVILRDSRASVVFVSAELYDEIAPAIAQNILVRKVVVIGGEAPEGTLSLQDFIANAPLAETIELTPDETAFWLYSSGSTGQPKGVRHVHGSLKCTYDTYGAQVLGIAEDDVVHSVAKMFFAYGLGNALTFPLAVGATTVLYAGRPTPESASAVLADERPTVFCGVPTLYAALLHHWDKAGIPENPDLRICISAGEALPEEVGKRWKAATGVDILDGVGSTEMLHIFLSNKPGDIVYGTSGTAVPGYDVRLVDEDGRDLGPGEVGELLVRGQSAAEGYWNQRSKSRSTFEGQWTRTGDKYEMTEAGRFVYCGRTDDMFKVSGIWVSPFEIEQALVSHPAVLEAAVVAWAGDDGLEKPKAFVVLKDPEQAGRLDELKDHVKTRIGKWKYPRWIEVIEQLPKTATGKIQRFKLRQERG